MRPFILILLLLSSVLIYGQTLQTYTGNYESGTATYQYYENENYERVLNGNFTYNQRTHYSITGQFKDNLRNGVWKATATEKNYNDQKISIKVVTATYIAGDLEGVCNYSHTDVITKKVLAKSTAHFKNNVMIGNYTHFLNEDENNFTINISLNQDGFADSTSTIKYKFEGRQFEHILKYRNGFLYWELHRDLSDGRIIKKLDRKKLIDQIYSNYDSTLKVSIVPEVCFSVYENSIISKDSREFAEIKNDTLYYENAPFTFLRSDLPNDYGYFWNLHIGINFWVNGNCEYCGTRYNPLNQFPKGANTVFFQPVKGLAIQNDIYQKCIEVKTIADNKKRRQQLLDSLRIAALLSIDWVTVTDTSKTLNDFSISLTPITKKYLIAYEDFNHNLVVEDNDVYYKQRKFGAVYDKNKVLEQSIDDFINKRAYHSRSGYQHNNQQFDNADDVVKIVKWLGLRLATDSEVSLAISYGLLNPMPPYIENKVYYFVK